MALGDDTGREKWVAERAAAHLLGLYNPYGEAAIREALAKAPPDVIWRVAQLWQSGDFGQSGRIIRQWVTDYWRDMAHQAASAEFGPILGN